MQALSVCEYYDLYGKGSSIMWPTLKFHLQWFFEICGSDAADLHQGVFNYPFPVHLEVEELVRWVDADDWGQDCLESINH